MYKFPSEKLVPLEEFDTSKEQCVVISCGSFNPPTFLHLRLFENARDHLEQKRGMQIVGGFMSPVNDRYEKDSLTVKGIHRINMCHLAAESSSWLSVDPWEVEQSEYQRTYFVLRHFEEEVHKYYGMEKIRVMLLCGADLLQSFTKGIWKYVPEMLGHFGVVCVDRDGSDVEKLVYEHDILHQFAENIVIVRQWITNNVSSTEVRRHVRRGMSLKYVLDDKVIDYIREKGFYH